MGWSPERLTPLLNLAARYKRLLSQKEAIRTKIPLNLLTLFFEPSTRTRLSFECAAHRLGLNVLTMADAVHESSSRKGETLEDMARIVSAYADVVVIRHPELGSALRFSTGATVPVINAGDGPGEHPTQSLVDLFTIREAYGALKGLRVGLCGDLRYGRTIHSLLQLLLAFECEVIVIAPEELGIPREVLQRLPPNHNGLRANPDLKGVLPDLDVLYMTRIQKERFHDIDVYERIRSIYRLTAGDLEQAPDHLRVLHPLPRVDEIASDVDASSRALYFTQSANGVPVRMALLSAILGSESFVVPEDLFSAMAGTAGGTA